MIMSSGADISPLVTAASPITSPPTIDTAPPTVLGSLRPASRRISNMIITISISETSGRGVLSSDAIRLKSSGLESTSE